MAKDDRTEDVEPSGIEEGYIDEVDRSLNPYGRSLRYNRMHADVVPIVLDEFGPCAYCVKHGHWKANA